MRCYLVGKAMREKHLDTLGRMLSMVTNLNKRTREVGMALRQVKERRENLKVCAMELD